MTSTFFYDDEMLLLKQDNDVSEGMLLQQQDNVQPISVDTTHLWSTDQIFETIDDLKQWAKNVGKDNGYAIVTGRSDYSRKGGNMYIVLRCSKHGVYIPYKDPKSFKYNSTRSQKCNCPFKLKGRPTEGDRNWWLKVLEGVHNHEPARSLVGYSYAGRLTEEEKVQVDSMNNNWVPPRHMLATLKENNPGNLSTITQVYNRIKKVKELDRGPLTEMQYLLKKLAEANYVHFERHEEDSGVIMELFWAHPNAIKLFNTFPHVVIMDCTYKTKKFQIPLLEMVGLTSTGLTYSIAFCYMTRERTPDYVWALECMKSLLADPARLPGVIVTDRELDLLSAVRNIFPEATHLLCLFHINKNVEAKCKLWVDTTYFKALVMQKWNEVVYAETATQFEEE
ncbi:protein FAR1-RELATED SEQUENCE 5-like [Lotus japonicus]|uniref:protein FAR1-RELATED SEQUENCE 5-like n=1 Tax=Lotus japonicus TaxID=34305 RepID=UPI002588C871|nr:protein FAR1-RELATED SEQUENCE 5-like [Lotus japonicus]